MKPQIYYWLLQWRKTHLVLKGDQEDCLIHMEYSTSLHSAAIIDFNIEQQNHMTLDDRKYK